MIDKQINKWIEQVGNYRLSIDKTSMFFIPHFFVLNKTRSYHNIHRRGTSTLSTMGCSQNSLDNKDKITRVRGKTCISFTRHGKVMGSRLGHGLVSLVHPYSEYSASEVRARTR